MSRGVRLAYDRNGLPAFDREWLKARDAREHRDSAAWTERELARVTEQLRTDLDAAEAITLETKHGIVYATSRLAGRTTEIALEPSGIGHSTIDSAILRRLAGAS